MHDIGSTYMETEEAEGFQPETFEFQPETFEYEATRYNGGTHPVLGEAEEMELAVELLEARDEAELDRFIGNLLSKAGKALGTFVKSPTGQALGGILKGAAAQALPVIGGAIGGAIGGQRGQDAGSQVASALGKAVGLQELESLNAEDREFEVARGLVRFGAEAVRNAATADSGADPRAAARAAAIQAAKAVAPGLLRSNGAGGDATARGGGAAGSQPRTGRWLRRGSRIVLYGV